jgi:ATP-dependent Clp protease, protease subunit
MIKKFFALRKNKAEHIGFKAQSSNDELELQVYDVIGSDFFGDGITVGNFSDALKQSPDCKSIKCRINSPGGDVFEAVAIYNLLRGCGKPVSVVVEGLAASAASVIAMAGDTCTMGEGSVMMIHNAMMMAVGNADEMRKCADILDTVSGSIADIYASCTGMPKADVQKLMDAETWMDAEEAVNKGFADEVANNGKIEARAVDEFNLAVYNNVPDSLKDGMTKEAETPITAEEDPLINIFRKRLDLLRRA